MSPERPRSRRCPCGLGESYSVCCRPLHRGRRSGAATATTAERLMRSRYSAFAVGDRAYLLATWHPSTRPATLDLDPDLTWQRLDVLATAAGAEGDATGTVEFVAHHRDTAGRDGQQHEVSVFVREAGEWLYVGPQG
ncbi:YchJ family protein [Patulibacter sp.]|uniref:YchJ family protein n=1 Tax=Patulibacter sp. TaxID=1912859 RepID=UPI002727F28F|nr:YchJ family metal-binding protein [Patulibacter sp.]MDO9408306.1 YchJ family metal-binding protein [Patulibacter sp.]